MPTAKPTAPRRRNRKRKRRLASSSSSSDSSDSSSDEKTPVKRAPLKKQATPSPAESPTSSSSSSSSLSSSAPSSSDSENENDAPHVVGQHPVIAPISSTKPRHDDSGLATFRPRSPSPSPPPADAPAFLPPEGTGSGTQDEQALRNRFRQFWMASVADAFGDDLEQIRQVRRQSEVPPFSTTSFQPSSLTPA
jgi:hypothetical protein